MRLSNSTAARKDVSGIFDRCCHSFYVGEVSMRRVLAVVSILGGVACAATSDGHTVAGDWDAYVASGSTPLEGFEGWRRQAFAHFAGRDSAFVGSIRRRTGEPMLEVSSVTGN